MAENMTLLFKVTLAKIDTIELDASISEQHDGEVEVTDHPVERGANISDHARPKPNMLTIEGLISNTPLSRAQQTRIIDAGGVSIETSSQRDAPAYAPGRAEEQYQKLVALKDAGRAITVVTARRTYENMVLTRLSAPVTSQTGEALRFTASFKQIRLVENKTTKVTIKASTPRPRPKINNGKKPVSTTPQATVKKSGLSRLNTLLDGGIFDTLKPPGT